MALHDYVCLAHGRFESLTGKCPHSCGDAMVQRVFNDKPPSFNSSRSANIDRTLQGLADERGLTDMNNRGGQAVFQPDPNMNKSAELMRQQMLSGQTYAAGMASGENAISGTLAEGGFQSGNAIGQVRELLTPPKPNVQGTWDGKA